MKRAVSAAEYRRQHVLILGLGLQGGAEAAVRFFCRAGSIVRVSDKKTAVELTPTMRRLKHLPIGWRLGHSGLADVRWAQYIVRNPSVPASAPELRLARRLKILIISDTTTFFDLYPGPIFAVTGTRGKTTTTHLLHAMVRQKYPDAQIGGNQPRRSLFDLLKGAKPSQPAVVELSSFQLEDLRSPRNSPRLAVLTNLKVDHLNRYSSMKEYAEAKFRLLHAQKKSDAAVLNADDTYVRRSAKLTQAHIVWFSAQGPRSDWSIYPAKGWIVERRKTVVTRIVSLRRWHLAGHHQLMNLLAAIAGARAVGIPVSAIVSAASAFRGVPDRQEVIRVWRRHQIINDTTATTPDGTLAAIDVFPRGLFILGGTDKNLQFGPLAKRLAGRRLPIITLPGTATDLLTRAIRRRAPRLKIFTAQTMPEAVKLAAKMVMPGEPIVLSPGAASFGLFKNEFDRGHQFHQAVRRLP